MHDIWNPWHGCNKVSEGCEHCYMYFLDRMRGADGSIVYKTKSGFDYPLKRNIHGNYKIKSGELIRVCMTSDFFLPSVDKWRDDAWRIIKIRSDVKFFILTKRPERVLDCLPTDWGDGWDNVFFNITAENQKRADERIPLLLDLPFKHKGIMTAPLIGPVYIDKYLNTGQIEQVIAGGENYDGARPCNFDWIKSLRTQCEKNNVTFCFLETGTKFIKDRKTYNIPKKSLQSEMAFKSNMNFVGRPVEFNLVDEFGAIPKENLYVPKYRDVCEKYAGRLICNGCSNCGKCNKK